MRSARASGEMKSLAAVYEDKENCVRGEAVTICVCICWSMDPRCHQLGALFCHLPTSQVSTLANAVPRLQNDRLCVDWQLALEHADPGRVTLEGYERER
ncbi:Protein of unknown function [Gryllus bimaculatus]|nr:Protein of unknown function [Gryllus bimaculatus]